MCMCVRVCVRARVSHVSYSFARVDRAVYNMWQPYRAPQVRSVCVHQRKCTEARCSERTVTLSL